MHGKRGSLNGYMTKEGFGSHMVMGSNGVCMEREGVWVGT